MAVTKQDVINAARKYLGVKYGNQGRSFDSIDCGGLVLVVGRELGLTELEHLGYANNPDGETFERLLNENCIEVEPKENLQIADLIACDYGDGIQHCAFVTDPAISDRIKVIHAKRTFGACEQYLHGYDRRGWVKTYRIKGVTD